MNSIVALAGRRIDAPGSVERFPAKNRDLVCARITDRLREIGATVIIASAACGADLLGHQAARALGIRSRVFLPFDRATFRAKSVVDRPGDWGPVFDDVCDAAEAAGDLVVNATTTDENAAYAAANRAILDDAAALAGLVKSVVRVLALVVWEGAPRGAEDLTADFAEGARRRRWAIETVATR